MSWGFGAAFEAADAPRRRERAAGEVDGGRYWLPDTDRTLKSWTRCTTFVAALDEGYGLDEWQARMTALGLAASPDLVREVAALAPGISLGQSHPTRLREIQAEAADIGGANVASARGTWLHDQSEAADLAVLEGDADWIERVDPAARDDIAAYRVAMEAAGLEVVAIEEIMSAVIYGERVAGRIDRVVRVTRELTVSLPGFRPAGTPESGPGSRPRVAPRVVRLSPGDHVILDVKTGRVDMGQAKIAGQLAVYSRASAWRRAPDYRQKRPPCRVRTDVGLVAHMPAGSGTCTLVGVDLIIGWQGALRAGAVRSARRLAGKVMGGVAVAEPDTAVEGPWRRAIAAADSHEELSQVAVAMRSAGADSEALRAAGRARRSALYADEAKQGVVG